MLHETPCPAIANKETEIEIEYVLNVFSEDIYIYIHFRTGAS